MIDHTKIQTHAILCGDCIEMPKLFAPDAFDLVIGSPPYEDARTYGIDFNLKGDEYVQWAADRFMAQLAVCKGLVAWVIDGRTRRFEYSLIPMMLAIELRRRGAIVRRPPIYYRHSIPGGGGRDWLRNDYELIICATRHRRKLPWADVTACGHPPKYGCFGGNVPHGYTNGDVSHVRVLRAGGPFSNRTKNGDRVSRAQKQYEKANPGNVIECVVGGGKMGSKLAHKNEAPFPLKLAEFFIRSFCPPGGLVLDGFGGSGTTMHAAIKHGRRCVSIDVRPSQCENMKLRAIEALQALPKGGAA